MEKHKSGFRPHFTDWFSNGSVKQQRSTKTKKYRQNQKKFNCFPHSRQIFFCRDKIYTHHSHSSYRLNSYCTAFWLNILILGVRITRKYLLVRLLILFGPNWAAESIWNLNLVKSLCSSNANIIRDIHQETVRILCHLQTIIVIML